MFTALCCSQPTQACADCSKKVPTSDIALHKEMLCSAHHSLSLPKEEVSYVASQLFVLPHSVQLVKR